MSKEDFSRLTANLTQLRLPTMLADCEKLAREAAESNQPYEEYLLRLTELEVATRAANALASRIRQASFPVEKELDSYDFSASPSVNKQKILELSRCQWVAGRSNCCFIGAPGTGKPQPAEYPSGHGGMRG